MQFPAENSYPSSTFSMFVPALLKPSLINEILDKPDIRLEELLNEEDFVEELKRGNFRLIDFFAKNIQHIKQLLDYIIQVPSNSNDEKRAYQYPLLANEVFEANIDLIMNCFFLSNLKNTDKNYNYISPKKEFLENGRDNNETAAFDEGDNEHRMKINPKNENLLSYLFSFLDTKEELNPVLAGYFSKLLQKLLNRNQRAVIEFAYNNSKILFSMIEHIDQHSLAEIFPLFMCYQSYIFDNNTQEYLEIKLKAIDKIFDLLTDEKQHEKIAHVPDVLDEIMHRNETMADGKEVMAKILSPETFNTILSVFNKKINNSPASHIGNVVLLLIGHFSAKMSQYSSGGVYARYLQKELDEDPIVKMISQHLETLKNFLLVEKQTSISTTFGHNTQTLGIGRLKVVNIIERIIKLGSNRIYAQINSSGIVQILTDMFGQFIWNNMFHATYEKVVYTILDKRDPLLLEALFDKAGFVDYIIKEIKEEECEFPKSRRRVRKGNMGFIIRIANELNRLGGFEKTLEDQLKKNPEWEKLVVPNLKARNELNEKEMGGCHPRNMNFGLMDSLLAYAQSNSDTTGVSETNSTAFDALQPNQRLFISFPNYSDQNEQSNIQIAPQDQKGNEESGKASNSQDLTSYLPSDKLEAPKLGVEEAKHSLTIETSQSATNQPAIQKSYPVLNYSASQKLSSNDNQAKESMVTLNNLAIERELNLKSSETKTALISEYTSQNLSITSNKTVQEKSCDITQDTKSKDQIDLSKRVFEQLRSSNDILSRLKMEFNMSPTKASTNQEAEENSSISTPSTPNRSESYAPSPVSSPSGEQLLRSSMIETKSGKKVKLKVKKTEKLDGSKILDMINKFKGPSSSTSSIEFSYTDNSQSESGNLLSDPNLAMQEGLPQPAVATSLLMQSNALNQNIGLQKGN